MTNLLSLFLGAVLATNPVEAASNLLAGKAISAQPAGAVDPVEEAYQKLLEFDDSADTDIEKWIADAAKFAEAGAGSNNATLKAKVEQRIADVDKAYRTFVEQHPNHARARIAYGSYLNDNRDEPGAVKQWEEAKRIDPKLPAVWNNLANYYGHRTRDQRLRPLPESDGTDAERGDLSVELRHDGLSVPERRDGVLFDLRV